MLDNPRLTIRSETDFQVLVQLFVRVSGSSIPPAGLLQGLWSNVRAQFTLLALLSGVQRTIIDFSLLFLEKIFLYQLICVGFVIRFMHVF